MRGWSIAALVLILAAAAVVFMRRPQQPPIRFTRFVAHIYDTAEPIAINAYTANMSSSASVGVRYSIGVAAPAGEAQKTEEDFWQQTVGKFQTDDSAFEPFTSSPQGSNWVTLKGPRISQGQLDELNKDNAMVLLAGKVRWRTDEGHGTLGFCVWFRRDTEVATLCRNHNGPLRE